MRILTRLIVVAVAFLVAPLAAGQEVVTTGPPPEIRALVDAFTGAVLGNSPETWEAMTREHCARVHLQESSRATSQALRHAARRVCRRQARSRHAQRS